MKYEFDRYIDGKLMAEGVTIEKAMSLAEATLIAAKIAPRGQNGQPPVLVFANSSARIETLEAALRLYAGFENDGIKWEPIDDKGGVARAALAGEKKDG